MVNFPSSLDDNDSLFLAGNNLRTNLTADINSSTLTIPVTTTSGYPSTGFVSILTGSDIRNTEAIKYTSTGATQFNASERGADGTTAVAHLSSNNVDFTIVAAHHNEVKDAIIELERFVGVSGSTNFVTKDQFGNVVISGTTSFQGITVSGTANFDGDTVIGGDLTVSGTATVEDLLTAASGIVTGEFIAASGIFTDTLTISGVPVATGTGGGGGASTLQDAYDLGDGVIVTAAGKPVAVSGELTSGDFTAASGVVTDVLTMGGDIEMDGNVLKNAGVVVIQPEEPAITVSGLLWFDTDDSDLIAALPGGITNASGTFTQSLTISGIPVATGTSLYVTRTFFTAPTSGASATVENIVVIAGGIIQSWTQA